MYAIEIAQSEDLLWRWRIHPDEMWAGGYATYQAAYDDAYVALWLRGC